MDNKSIEGAMKIKLDVELPKYQQFIEGMRRAPKRESELSAADVELAVKNALRYMNKTISIKEDIFGKTHESTKNSYKNISKIYTELDDKKNASIFLDKSNK